MVIDELLARYSATLKPLAGVPASIAQISMNNTPAVLVRSATFMNHSGQAVVGVAKKYGIPSAHIVVIHDELDFPVGKVRLKQGGNENGHNGLKSISRQLGTRDYLRIRLGIGRPPAGVSVIDHVLGTYELSPEMQAMVNTGADAAEEVISKGFTAAQNTIHAR